MSYIRPISRILIVDDDYVFAETVRGGLLGLNAEIHFAENGRSALQTLSAMQVDLVITDTNMEPIDGISLLNAIKHRLPELPVIVFFSGSLKEPHLTSNCIAEMGAAHVLEKTGENLNRLPLIVGALMTFGEL